MSKGSAGGKGDKRRPGSGYGEGYDRIFKKAPIERGRYDEQKAPVPNLRDKEKR